MRKIIFLVLLAVVALAPVARAQAPRGYYDQYGQYHEYSNDDGYYDGNGQWHPNDSSTNDGYYDNQGVWHPNDAGNRNGYYDRNGVWHPNDTANGNGYYDRNGVWQSHGNDRYGDRYGRAAGPDRWTWSDNRGRAESLVTAARNFSLTAASVDREAYRRSRYSDRAALDALRQLDERAQYFARQVESDRVQGNRVQSNRGNGVGRAYADVVDSYLAVRSRFGAVAPDAWLSNQFHVMSAALGRIDKRFFGSRAFGGQLPDQGGYDQSYGYDRYGNPLPGYDRDGRGTRPYPY